MTRKSDGGDPVEPGVALQVDGAVLAAVHFGGQGLLPAVVQDAGDGTVLMPVSYTHLTLPTILRV